MERFRETRAGNDFDELYRGARASVLGWAVHYARRQGLALDPLELMQDTFVNIYRYAGGFRAEDDGSFRRWARTITANVVRRAARTRYSGPPTTGAHDGHLEEVADPRPSPEHSLVQREARRPLQQAYGLVLLHYARAFAELSERDQRALHLVEVEGLAYREVAERLGVGASNMKMIVFRARTRLRRSIERAFALAAA